MLLHFALVLHFAAIITFRGVTDRIAPLDLTKFKHKFKKSDPKSHTSEGKREGKIERAWRKIEKVKSNLLNTLLRV